MIEMRWHQEETFMDDKLIRGPRRLQYRYIIVNSESPMFTDGVNKWSEWFYVQEPVHDYDDKYLINWSQ